MLFGATIDSSPVHRKKNHIVINTYRALDKIHARGSVISCTRACSFCDAIRVLTLFTTIDLCPQTCRGFKWLRDRNTVNGIVFSNVFFSMFSVGDSTILYSYRGGPPGPWFDNAIVQVSAAMSSFDNSYYDKNVFGRRRKTIENNNSLVVGDKAKWTGVDIKTLTPRCSNVSQYFTPFCCSAFNRVKMTIDFLSLRHYCRATSFQ